MCGHPQCANGLDDAACKCPDCGLGYCSSDCMLDDRTLFEHIRRCDLDAESAAAMDAEVELTVALANI